MKTRVVLIGNPASGRGAGDRTLDEAEAALRSRGCDTRIFRTAQAGQAVELAAAAAGGVCDLVLVVGGDGTLRDVAQGMAGAELPVALLPRGTGNDVARCLRLPHDVDGALDVALEGDRRALDVWRWNDSAFVNVAGMGLDAAVARAVNERAGRTRGTLAYLLAFLKVLPGYRPWQLSVRAGDTAWDGPVWLAAFANCRSYGGGMQIAPDAAPDDGLLDVVIVGAVTKLELLRQFPRIFRGRHTRHPQVRVLRCTGAELLAGSGDITLDGEMMGEAPASITRAEAPLWMCVPAADSPA